MGFILIAWSFLCLIFLGVPGVYYLYMRRVAYKPWKLKVNESYSPRITIIVPTYNEANVIGLKLENLYNLKYAKDRTQIILIDSASTDDTVDEASKFVRCHSEMDIKILREYDRGGKSRALNLALKYATGDVIVVSDADCFLPSDILLKSLPFLSDPSVGALAGREVFLNPKQSWVTLTETAYRDSVAVIKLGESKLYSTIFFEGGFSAYKREFLSEFDCKTGSDDCGTALRIVQKKARAIFIPEATFFTVFPVTWKGKITIKMRRANQLVRLWIECLGLLLRKELFLSKKIAVPELFLYLFNPIVFLSLAFTTFIVILGYMPYSVVFPLFLLLVLLIPKTRLYFVEALQSNCILLGALFAFMLKKKYVVWSVVKEKKSQSLLTRDILKRKSLI